MLTIGMSQEVIGELISDIVRYASLLEARLKQSQDKISALSKEVEDEKKRAEEAVRKTEQNYYIIDTYNSYLELFTKELKTHWSEWLSTEGPYTPSKSMALALQLLQELRDKKNQA